MNYWTMLSIEYANQKNYLDELYKVYPTIPEGIREVEEEKWNKIEKAYYNDDKISLIKDLLSLELFPIKDSYVAYLRRDPTAIERNPKTVERLVGRLKEMGLNKIWESCTQPKETNRQIGPLFKRWLQKGVLGIDNLNFDEFKYTKGDAILLDSETKITKFARDYLEYNREKNLDFLCRINGRYIIGEAKFLTDFGGHQNAQFNDALSIFSDSKVNAIKLAILDGVLYIKGKNKMFKTLKNLPDNFIVLSALVLREFLYQI